MIKEILDLLFSATDVIIGITTIPWVWFCIGTAVWVTTIWLSIKITRPSCEKEAAYTGSIFGLMLGVFSPFFVAVMPIVLAVLLIVALVGGMGIIVAYLIGRGRK